jgi:cytochrome c biogenesis protein CcmG/thiol:disulfide interchange protein DsbE
MVRIYYYIWVRRGPFLLSFLALLLLSGCYTGTRPPRIGNPAPDFTVKDDDRTVKLSDYRGQVVVLNFWASWCPPCVEEAPSLVKMQARLKDKGVVVVGVSEDADEAAYHRFLEHYNMNIVAVRDPSAKTKALYGTVLIPETFVIDRKGVVRRKFVSSVDWTSPEVIDFLTKL